jgi:hypothetical protein
MLEDVRGAIKCQWYFSPAVGSHGRCWSKLNLPLNSLRLEVNS